MGQSVAASAVDWQIVREELAAQRKNLFERLLRDPNNIRLAAEIRRLDDEVCVCSEHMARDRSKMLTKTHS